MGAKFALLTHFSQRYPKYPSLEGYGEEKLVTFGLAFDLMSVTQRQLTRVSLFTPLLSQLFKDEDQSIL